MMSKTVNVRARASKGLVAGLALTTALGVMAATATSQTELPPEIAAKMEKAKAGGTSGGCAPHRLRGCRVRTSPR